MAILEIRRHCFTKKGEGRGQGSHLSRKGVQQARRIGDGCDPFTVIWTSTIPRTLETAVAMGFAVDRCLDELGHVSRAVWEEIGHHERWEWENPFARFAQVIATDGPTAHLAQTQCTHWEQAAKQADQASNNNGRVLIVSHGRVLEAGLIASLSPVGEDELVKWENPFQHGEGFPLHYQSGAFRLLDFCANRQHHYPGKTTPSANEDTCR